jgi:hypothetical protein
VASFGTDEFRDIKFDEEKVPRNLKLGFCYGLPFM